MKGLRASVLVGLCALMLSSCTLISPNSAPDHISRKNFSFGLLNRTIPGTNRGRVEFITKPVYMVDASGDLTALSRIVPSPPSLSTVVQQLLLGPTNIEKSAGYTSALPSSLVLISSSIRADVGYLNFAASLNDLSNRRQLRAVGQLVLTAYASGATDGIVINVAGVSQALLMPNGERASLVSVVNFKSLLNT